MTDQELGLAIEDARGGQRENARRRLARYLKEHPQDVVAWFWLASLVTNPNHKQDCLKAVLRIDPSNRKAKHALAEVAQSSNRTTSTTHNDYVNSTPSVSEVTTINRKPTRTRQSLSERKRQILASAYSPPRPNHNIQKTYPMKQQGNSGNVGAAIASFILPGLGQLAQGRGKDAIRYFLGAFLLWGFALGWIFHIVAAYDAAVWEG